MAAIESFYPAGGVQTNTEGLPLTQGADFSGILAELVRRRMQQPQAQSAYRQPTQAPMREPVMRGWSSKPAPMPSTLERAQQRDALLQIRDRQQIPMHYSGSGFNLPQRLEPDESRMSPMQMRMVRPDSAGFAPGMADTLGNRQDAAEDTQDYADVRDMQQASMDDQRQRDRARYAAQLQMLYGLGNGR